MTGPEALIGLLLPEQVAVAESFGDQPEDAAGSGLFPAEEEAVRKSVDKRRREYTSVRRCARQALAQLGFPPAPILNGAKREPLWPDGVIGSMTHCEGYRAAVVARAGKLVSLGIDAEPHGPLPDGVLGSVTRPEELEHLTKLEALRPELHWGRLLFSAKESVYKTWFPVTRCWLGFQDAALEFAPAAEAEAEAEVEAAAGADFDGVIGGVFTAKLFRTGLELGGQPVDQLTGRWLVARGLVITAIALPAAG